MKRQELVLSLRYEYAYVFILSNGSMTRDPQAALSDLQRILRPRDQIQLCLAALERVSLDPPLRRPTPARLQVVRDLTTAGVLPPHAVRLIAASPPIDDEAWQPLRLLEQQYTLCPEFLGYWALRLQDHHGSWLGLPCHYEPFDHRDNAKPPKPQVALMIAALEIRGYRLSDVHADAPRYPTSITHRLVPSGRRFGSGRRARAGLGDAPERHGISRPYSRGGGRRGQAC